MNTIQKRLFETIKSKIKENHLLAVEISQLLGVSLDAAYNRINNKTELRIGEIQLLCKKYRLSFDALTKHQTDVLSFERNIGGLFDEKDSHTTVFKSLFETLSRLSLAKKKEFIYYCKEIPIFQILQVPELLAFKLYYWDAIEKDPVKGPESFEIGMQYGSEKSKPLINELIQLYIQVPSTEIIHGTGLAAIAMQILYFFESGKFSNPKEALLLVKKLQSLNEHLRIQATLGKKFRFGTPIPEKRGKGNFKLYQNEIMHAQNIALARMDGNEKVFLECNVLDFISTEDSMFCDSTSRALDKIMAKSNLISSNSEKERNKFFLLQNEGVQKVKNQIESNLGA